MMKMNILARSIWFVCILVLTCTKTAYSEDLPNIVVIMADDLGYTDLGCYGCQDIRTPNIDQLASDGMRFTSAYVTGNMCGPSRAGFLTGRVQSTFGYYKNVSNPYATDQGLPENIPTFVSMLQDRGYATGGVGKWHMGTADHQHPNAKGFDDWFGFLGGGLMYFPLDHRSYNGKFTPLQQPLHHKYVQHTMPVIHNRTPVQWEQYLTRELTDAGIAFLDKHHEQPFFLFMSYNAPHLDLEAPEETIALYPPAQATEVPGVTPNARSVYAAMVDEMDQGIGRLLNKIDKLDLADNTIVWFLSDHGGMRKTSDNRPLRGHKGNSYEGGLRVPLIVRWPGNVPAGTVRDGMITSLDIGATSVAMAEGDGRVSGLQGKDIRDYLTGHTQQSPHETLFWHTGRAFKKPAGAMRKGNYKLMYFGDKKKPELYNLSADLSESTNLASQEPERTQEMVSAWKEWAKNSKPDLWKESKVIQHADYDWLQGHPHHKDQSKRQ